MDANLCHELTAQGALLKIGPFVAKLRVELHDHAKEVADLYEHYPRGDAAALWDFEVDLRPPNLWRRIYRPQIQAYLDNQTPVSPLPHALSLPMLESVMNWWAATQTARYLLLHAAVLERDGVAIVLPGNSGSGKSTLSAGLLARGWRLLSDELAMIRPQDGALQAYPRPLSLKNASIELVSKLLPDAHISRLYTGTVKGTVAFMRAPDDAILRADELARPTLVVFPTYQPNARATLEPLPKSQAFGKLTDHSANYFRMLRLGFETLSRFVDSCRHHTLMYCDLHEAITVIDRLAATRSEDVSRA